MTLTEVLDCINPMSPELLDAARERQDQLTKPAGSLTILEDIGVRLSGIQGIITPRISGKAVAVFAADHGVTDEGVSAYPRAVTEQMVLNFLAGGAAISALCNAQGVKLIVVDVGVDADFPEHPQLIQSKVRKGSRNMLGEAAMTEDELQAAFAAGFEAAERLRKEGANLVAAGDMGIGNTTPATAIISTLTGISVADLAGRGTGVDDEGLKRKIDVIERAIEKHRVSKDDPLELLQSVGGLELAAMTGFYLRAGSLGLAIMLDGFVSHSAALVATALKPELKAYLFASHSSRTEAHKVRYEMMGVTPLLDFSLRLGEGSGAVLAMPLIESAAAILSDMATFAEAGVSEKDA